MESNFYLGKKVVVTGGAGFIGTHFLKELVKRGALVKTSTFESELQYSNPNIEVVKNIDLRKLEDCIKLIDGADIVVHCAGKIAHPSTVPTDIQISLNQLLIIGNVLDACVKTNVGSFLDLNSSTGYPDIREPLEEDRFWESEPYKSYFGYGWMRRYREKLMEHVYKFSNLQIKIARCTAIFGPNDNFDLKSCHVVPALIKRVLSDENPLVVWGSPDVVRDFLYVKDVVKASLLVLESGETMRPYNVGSGTAITIGDIVNSIIKNTNKKPVVSYDETKPTTIPFRMVSTERLKKELEFEPSYTFDEGIKETIDWYLQNEKNIV